MSAETEKELRRKALEAAVAYSRAVHAPRQGFTPGERIGYGGRWFDEREMELLIDASLDFWLTAGRYAEAFEARFAGFLGIGRAALVNSGSSANLLAFMALTSPELGERRIQRGDEVITVAAGFPTTVTPILQYGAVPVFVDVTLPTCNVDCSRLEAALSPRSRAVMLAHTLGNPFDLAAVKAFCEKHQLWLIEDNCDALGARYCLGGEWRQSGTIGDLGTSSFYPPHHMTMGEGGAVYSDNPQLMRIVESLRDWGRDCWCPPGKDDSCGRRFDRSFGELPAGYDHKYVYSRFGYNLKVTEMQAAIGCAQLDKLPDMIAARKRNWALLREGLAGLEEFFILPEATAQSDPSWFGFLLVVRPGAPFTRAEVVAHLEGRGIQTRMLFAGNLVRQPCFDELRGTQSGYRVAGDLENTDRIMRDAFWLGVYPGLTPEMLGFVCDEMHRFAGRR